MKKLLLSLLFGLGSVISHIDATIFKVTYLTSKEGKRVVLLGDQHEEALHIPKEEKEEYALLQSAAQKQLPILTALVKNIKESCTFQIESPVVERSKVIVTLQPILKRLVDNLDSDEYKACDHRDEQYLRISKLLRIIINTRNEFAINKEYLQHLIPSEAKTISDFKKTMLSQANSAIDGVNVLGSPLFTLKVSVLLGSMKALRALPDTDKSAVDCLLNTPLNDLEKIYDDFVFASALRLDIPCAADILADSKNTLVFAGESHTKRIADILDDVGFTAQRTDEDLAPNNQYELPVDKILSFFNVAKKNELSGLPQCYSCSKTEKSMKLCSRCKAIHYCSVECQKDHWNKHKKTCKPADTTNPS